MSRSGRRRPPAHAVKEAAQGGGASGVVFDRRIAAFFASHHPTAPAASYLSRRAPFGRAAAGSRFRGGKHRRRERGDRKMFIDCLSKNQ